MKYCDSIIKWIETHPTTIIIFLTVLTIVLICRLFKLRKKIIKKQRVLDATYKHISEMEYMQQRLSEEKESAVSNIEVMKITLEEQRTKNTNNLVQLNAKNSRLIKELSTASSEKRELKSKLSSTIQQLNFANKEKETLNDQIRKLTKSNSALSSSVEKKQNKIACLEQDINCLNGELNEKNALLKEKNKFQDELEENINLLTEAKVLYETREKELQNNIERLTNEISDLKLTIALKDSEIQNFNSQLNNTQNLREDVDRLESHNQELEEKICSMGGEINVLNYEICEKIKENESVKIALEQERNTLSKERNRIKYLEAELEQLRAVKNNDDFIENEIVSLSDSIGDSPINFLPFNDSSEDEPKIKIDVKEIIKSEPEEIEPSHPSELSEDEKKLPTEEPEKIDRK